MDVTMFLKMLVSWKLLQRVSRFHENDLGFYELKPVKLCRL